MSQINANDLYEIKRKAFASSHVLNENFEGIKEAHNDLEHRVREIEGSPLSDAEVQSARGGYDTIKERLDAGGAALGRDNAVIKGMEVIDIYYPSEETISFTIQKGEVLIQGKPIQVTRDIAFTDLVLEDEYQVVLCDTSGEISVLRQEISNFEYPHIGQNKRPLYLFKKVIGHDILFYDCRQWGVISLAGWHFTLQEAFEGFVRGGYFDRLHALGHRNLMLEYEGTMNRLSTQSETLPLSDALRQNLSQWTLHLKGKSQGEFLIEGHRHGHGYGPTVIDGYDFKQVTVENIYLHIAPWYVTPSERQVAIGAKWAIVKDCNIDYQTNDTGAGIHRNLLSEGRKYTYLNTHLKMRINYSNGDYLRNSMGLYQCVGLRINDVLVSSQSVLADPSAQQDVISTSKHFILFEYTLKNVNLNTSSPITLIRASNDHNRLLKSEFVLKSAIAKTQSYIPDLQGESIFFSNDIASAGFFYFDLASKEYRVRSLSSHVRNTIYNDITLKLTFKVYTWDLFLFKYR